MNILVNTRSVLRAVSALTVVSFIIKIFKENHPHTHFSADNLIFMPFWFAEHFLLMCV